jgi:hypothetical protein
MGDQIQGQRFTRSDPPTGVAELNLPFDSAVSSGKIRRSSPRTRRESMARQIAPKAVKANSTVLTLHLGPPEFGSK